MPQYYIIELSFKYYSHIPEEKEIPIGAWEDDNQAKMYAMRKFTQPFRLVRGGQMVSTRYKEEWRDAKENESQEESARANTRQARQSPFYLWSSFGKRP